MNRPRLAVVGAGAWGSNHVRVAASEPRCELAAIVDRDPDALERASHLAPGVALLGDADAVFGDPAIDAVIISTPSPTHASLSLSALAAGKHVLVEKPLAMSALDARRIADAARAADRTVVVGHLMVYHPAVVRLRELVHAGALGRLHYVHSTRANLGRIRSDESVLWSFGPHDLSMLDFLLERSPVRVSAQGQSIVHRDVDDVVFATLEYDDGQLAQLVLSRMHPRKERTLTLVGSDRLVHFDDVAAEKLRIFDRAYEKPPQFTEFGEYLTIGDGNVQIPQLAMAEPLRIQLRELLDSIVEHRLPRTDVESGVRIVSILDAAQQSLARRGAPVEIYCA